MSFVSISLFQGSPEHVFFFACPKFYQTGIPSVGPLDTADPPDPQCLGSIRGQLQEMKLRPGQVAKGWRLGAIVLVSFFQATLRWRSGLGFEALWFFRVNGTLDRKTTKPQIQPPIGGKLILGGPQRDSKGTTGPGGGGGVDHFLFRPPSFGSQKDTFHVKGSQIRDKQLSL